MYATHCRQPYGQGKEGVVEGLVEWLPDTVSVAEGVPVCENAAVLLPLVVTVLVGDTVRETVSLAEGVVVADGVIVLVIEPERVRLHEGDTVGVTVLVDDTLADSVWDTLALGVKVTVVDTVAETDIVDERLSVGVGLPLTLVETVIDGDTSLDGGLKRLPGAPPSPN